MEFRPFPSIASMDSVLRPFVLISVLICTFGPVCMAGSQSSNDVISPRLPASSPLARLRRSSRLWDQERRIPSNIADPFQNSILQGATSDSIWPGALAENRLYGVDFDGGLRRLAGRGSGKLLDLFPNVVDEQQLPTKRGYLFRRGSHHVSREELFKRSSLNELIRRLMAMNGQRFNYGRAATIRFGVGGRK